jgi:hypothetical protein
MKFFLCVLGGGAVWIDSADAKEIRPSSLRALYLLVPGAGIEPARCHHRGILSPVRLPIPPSRRRKTAIMTEFVQESNTHRIIL